MGILCSGGAVLTTQHRPAVTEQPSEHEQADGEGDPSPHLAEVGDPGDTGDLAGGEAAGGVHAERKDSGPAAHIVAEPGPEDLAGDQGKEPHHGQAPQHQGAVGEDLVLLAELPQRAGSLGDLASGEGGDGQRAASDPVVALAGEQFAQVEPGGAPLAIASREEPGDPGMVPSGRSGSGSLHWYAATRRS